MLTYNFKKIIYLALIFNFNRRAILLLFKINNNKQLIEKIEISINIDCVVLNSLITTNIIDATTRLVSPIKKVAFAWENPPKYGTIYVCELLSSGVSKTPNLITSFLICDIKKKARKKREKKITIKWDTSSLPKRELSSVSTNNKKWLNILITFFFFSL